MEQWIPKFYRNYGVYANTSKMLPSSVDGTIPVWKRLLLAAHTWARKDFVKSANIFGQTIAHWHPHTEAIQGSAEILVQNGFLDGKGNWGCNIGSQPEDCAAPRYTELRMNEFVEEIAFKYVDDAIWEEDELDKEPKVLPAMIPLCLFAKYELNMIGFGFKTEAPTYKLSDLIQRLLFLINQGPKIIIKPNIQGCRIKSTDEEFEKLLITKGKQSIQIEGIYTKDPKNFSVFIHGWSPRSNFSNVFDRIDRFNGADLMSSGDVSYLDESTDDVGTKIRFEVNRARNRELIYDKLVKAVTDRLSASISYHMYAVTPQKTIVETCVDEMLMNAYNNFLATLTIHFKRKIKEVSALIKELDIIKKIRPHIGKVYNLADHKEMITQLSTLTGLSYEDIDAVVNKYRIRKLLSVKLDIDACQAEVDGYKDKLKNVAQFALQCYKDLPVKAKERDAEEDKETRHRASLNKIQGSGVRPIIDVKPDNPPVIVLNKTDSKKEKDNGITVIKIT